MVLKATFNNIVESHFQQYFSYIMVEETGVPGENHRPATSQ
jgi:hypothetical protein